MRKLPLLLLLASIALPALAKKLTVQHFEQVLAADHAKPDADLAKELGDLELSERVSAAALASWQVNISGPKARLALVALADRAAFLSPPAEEIPDRTTPDFATQRRIMSLTADYVTRTIPKLPNFYAGRETIRFEDRPEQNNAALQLAIGFEPLHAVSSAKSTVLYRNGKEVVDTGAAKDGKIDSQEQGLNAWGLFGPILGTVLVDAGHGTLAWSHWESGAASKLAVFRYTVPKEKSNYEVSFCCIRDNRAIRALSGYHGEMAIDPATGTILRMTLMADLPLDALVQRADVEVEYGTEQIGGAEYVCPVRSISIYKARMIVPRGTYKTLGPFQTMLNDVLFSQYHLFRAETRILAAGDSVPQGSSVSPNLSGDKSPVGDSPANSSGSRSGEVNSAEASTPENSLVASLPDKTNLASAASLTGADVPEVTVSEAAGLPEFSAPETEITSEMDLTPRTSARVVDVNVVAYDKQGHAVTNLRREDFEIVDGEDEQTIASFTAPAPAGAQNAASAAGRIAAASPRTFSNRQADNSGARLEGQSDATILFLDGAHLNAADLAWVRDGILRFLPGLPADESIGLYAMKKSGFQIVAEATTDRTLLAARLSQWMQSNQDSSGDSDPSHDALPILIAVARHLAAIPGHKSLVWIAATLPAADESSKAFNAGQHLRTIDESVLRARNEMGDGNIGFYPLIASQPQSGAKNGDRTGKLSPQIEAPDLAEPTGGREFHRAGDLAAELRSAVDDGRAAYLLSFTPDVPADGTYHPLQVKLNPARDLTLRYRSGYLYDREPPTLKQRFHDLIWQQEDAKEIAVTADLAETSGVKTLKLNIATPDVDLASQDKLWTDKLDIYLAVRDDEAQEARITGKTLELRLKSATYQKLLREGIPFEQSVETKPGTTSVRIVVVDENSGHMGSITVPASALMQAH